MDAESLEAHNLWLFSIQTELCSSKQDFWQCCHQDKNTLILTQKKKCRTYSRHTADSSREHFTWSSYSRRSSHLLLADEHVCHFCPFSLCWLLSLRNSETSASPSVTSPPPGNSPSASWRQRTWRRWTPVDYLVEKCQNQFEVTVLQTESRLPHFYWD